MNVELYEHVSDLLNEVQSLETIAFKDNTIINENSINNTTIYMALNSYRDYLNDRIERQEMKKATAHKE